MTRTGARDTRLSINALYNDGSVGSAEIVAQTNCRVIIIQALCNEYRLSRYPEQKDVQKLLPEAGDYTIQHLTRLGQPKNLRLRLEKSSTLSQVEPRCQDYPMGEDAGI
ncbi:hypothetical protein TMatcc_002721 [Talaromyces marneffei ATCC 18224]